MIIQNLNNNNSNLNNNKSNDYSNLNNNKSNDYSNLNNNKSNDNSNSMKKIKIQYNKSIYNDIEKNNFIICKNCTFKNNNNTKICEICKFDLINKEYNYYNNLNDNNILFYQNLLKNENDVIIKSPIELDDKIIKDLKKYNRNYDDIINEPKITKDVFDLIETDGLDEILMGMFCYDFEYLFNTLPFLHKFKKITFICQIGEDQNIKEIEKQMRLTYNENINLIAPTLHDYGSNHSKFIILYYKNKLNKNIENSLRMIILTGNMYFREIYNINEALWYQDFPLINTISNNNNNNDDNFKKVLLYYLKNIGYNNYKRINNYNFKSANGYLVTSMPGLYDLSKSIEVKQGRLRIEEILLNEKKNEKKYNINTFEKSTNEKWKLVLQSTSFGNQKSQKPENGNYCFNWSSDDLTDAFLINKNDKHVVQICAPSMKEVETSIGGIKSAKHLRYNTNVLYRNGTNKLHKEINTRLYYFNCYANPRIHATIKSRNLFLPHIKSFFRYNPNENELAYCFITSHNTSKAAFGKIIYLFIFKKQNYFNI